MKQRFYCAGWRAGAGLLGLVLLAACRHETVVVPDYTDYFPLAPGSYRTYQVVDSSWAAGVVSTSQYQVRERVSDQFLDAAGQPAYRLVRSRRATTSAAWTDDSVLVAQPLARALLLTRSNVRTVELLYPPQAGKAWNKFAFTVNGQAGTYPSVVDTITSLTRRYGPSVNTAYTTAAAGSAPLKTYDATVTVADINPVDINDGNYRVSGYQQVFARGVGPVLRRQYYYRYFTTSSTGLQTLTPGKVQDGNSRRETLLETGTL